MLRDSEYDKEASERTRNNKPWIRDWQGCEDCASKGLCLWASWNCSNAQSLWISELDKLIHTIEFSDQAWEKERLSIHHKKAKSKSNRQISPNSRNILPINSINWQPPQQTSRIIPDWKVDPEKSLFRSNRHIIDKFTDKIHDKIRECWRWRLLSVVFTRTSTSRIDNAKTTKKTNPTRKMYPKILENYIYSTQIFQWSITSRG